MRLISLELGKEKLILSEFNIGVLASSEGFGALIGALIIGNISPQKQLASIFITGVTGFFIGKIMKASNGTADPKKTNQLLNQLLN